MTDTQVETKQFQAETRKVLDIVIHSLYTEKEIFVRELVSNASDALEKLRHLQLTEKEIFDDHLPLEINLDNDDKAKTFTIQDFGVGMTRAELVENLGTIAHSGSKAFLKELGEAEPEGPNLIGQFGVGFYCGLHGGASRCGSQPTPGAPASPARCGTRTAPAATRSSERRASAAAARSSSS